MLHESPASSVKSALVTHREVFLMCKLKNTACTKGPEVPHLWHWGCASILDLELHYWLKAIDVTHQFSI